MTGAGTATDAARGYLCFFRAANFINPSAMYQLGVIYCQGGVVTRDESKGFALLKKAASLGYADAAQYMVTYQQNKAAYIRSEKEGYLAQQAELKRHAAELERIRTNPKYDVICSNDRAPSRFNNGEQEFRQFCEWRNANKTAAIADYFRPPAPPSAYGSVIIPAQQAYGGVIIPTQQSPSGCRCVGVYNTVREAYAEKRRLEAIYSGYSDAVMEQVMNAGNACAMIQSKRYKVIPTLRGIELWEYTGPPPFSM